MALDEAVLTALVSALEQTRTQEMNVEQVQRLLWAAAGQFTSCEDRPLRERLENVESQLELIRFTVDQALVADRARTVIDSLVSDLKKRRLNEAHL